MTMLNRNGMRQPQTRNWSPEIALNTNTATLASNRPAGPPNCGHDVINSRCLLVAAHSIAPHGEHAAAAPLAANPDALDEADDRQDDGAPDADRLVGRHETDREGRKTGN